MPRHQLAPEIKEQMMQRLGELLSRREEVEFACAHGSFLDPESGFRDIDVAVWVASLSIHEEQVLDYEGELSAWLERHTPYPIDVKVLNFASLGFKYAASGGVLISARDRKSWYDFREKTWIEYLDFLPRSKQMLIDLLTSSRG